MPNLSHYINLHLRPDPETTPHQLLAALFTRLHRALAAAQKTPAGPKIAVGFPGYDGSRHTLGECLRLQLLHETPGSICVIDRFDDPVAMREFVNAGMLLAGGVCAAFTGSDADGYRYIIGSRTLDLRAEAKTINAAISGRGGGKPFFVQGSVKASEEEI